VTTWVGPLTGATGLVGAEVGIDQDIDLLDLAVGGLKPDPAMAIVTQGGPGRIAAGRHLCVGRNSGVIPAVVG
jgi:hypothetical protein